MTLMLLGMLLALVPNAHAEDAATTGTPSTTGATLVEPADGAHLDHLELAPMLQVDPSTDSAGKTETPKWILLATDAAMTNTVRYCRQFVWASSANAFHWGCNKWATGVDAYGNDQLLALESGKVYYWQAVSNTADGKGEVKSAVRSFAIDADPVEQNIADISAHITGTVFDDGSQLNLGAAALVNSGVRVKSIVSSRLAPSAFRIRLVHVGTVDYSRSYVKVTSAAGTRYLHLAKVGTTGAGTVWRLTRSEQRLRTKRFTYQAFLKSRKNGAMVKSPPRVVLIRSAPKWRRD
jgi:hypothetical protein